MCCVFVKGMMCCVFWEEPVLPNSSICYKNTNLVEQNCHYVLCENLLQQGQNSKGYAESPEFLAALGVYIFSRRSLSLQLEVK